MFVIVRGIKIDLSKSKTDSDIIDIAEEYGIPSKEIFSAIENLTTIKTNCEGCRHAGLRYTLHPCMNCSRNPSVKDHYSKEEGKR